MLSFPAQSQKFLNPERIISQLGLQEGMQVADFGCGAGDFSLAAARAVGTDGQVNAVDVQESALSSVRSKSKIQGILNINTIRANLEIYNSSGLADKSQDVVLLVNTLHQAGDKEGMLKECQRVLKDKGKLVVVDWDKNAIIGPAKEIRLDDDFVADLVAKSGFVFLENIDAGNYHFGMVFIKSS